MVAIRKPATWKSAAARRLLRLGGNAPTLDDAIEIVVGNLLDGVPHPPLVPEALFAKLNIARVEVEDIPFSGELRPEGAGYVIVCSAHLSRPRKRFTIAHEMAHALFELSGPNCPRRGKELERLCDKIAKELLMPRTVFSACMGKYPDVDDIFGLAGTFQTSIVATAIRCAELSNISVFEVADGAVLWGHGAIKKGSTRYLDSELQRLIQEAQVSRKGGEVLHLVVGGALQTWDVEYRGMEKNRALFVTATLASKFISYFRTRGYAAPGLSSRKAVVAAWTGLLVLVPNPECVLSFQFSNHLKSS